MPQGQLVRPKAERFVSLDSVRGIAAFLVVLEHAQGNGWITGSPLASGGLLAVQFFFVLSGFVICANYADRISAGFGLGKYLLLRLGRIWPLHAVILAVLLVQEGTALLFPQLLTWRDPFTGTNSVANWFLALFLLNGWQQSFDNLWSPQSWSLSVELFLYLAFALLWKWGRGVALPVAIAVFVILVIGNLTGLTGWPPMVRGLLGFASGTVAWEIHRRLSDRPLPAPTLAELAAVSACVAALWWQASLPLPLIDLVFVVAVLVLARDAGGVSRLLARPLPRLLGRISLSIYLVHPLVMGRLYDLYEQLGARLGQEWVVRDGVFKLLRAGGLTADLLALVAFVVVVLVSVLTFRFIEVPARAASRRLAHVPEASGARTGEGRWW